MTSGASRISKCQVVIMTDRSCPTLVGCLPAFLSMVPPRSGSVDSSVSLHPCPHRLEVLGKGMGHLLRRREYSQLKSSSCWLWFILVCCQNEVWSWSLESPETRYKGYQSIDRQQLFRFSINIDVSIGWRQLMLLVRLVHLRKMPDRYAMFSSL